MWELSMTKKPVGLTLDQAGFNIRVRSSGIPRYTQSAIEVYVRSNRMYDTNVMYPEGTITFSFIEHVEAPIRRFIFEWEDAIRTRAGSGVPGQRGLSLRDLTADFVLKTLDNHENANVQYTLGYCFLEESNLGEMAGNEAGATLMFPEITIKYNLLDRVILNGVT